MSKRKPREKLIITAAITGSDTLPSQTPYLPITPEEIAQSAYEAYKVGAAICHIHVRNPKTGEPSGDLEIWQETLIKIKEKTNGDMIICPTTGGCIGMTPQDRLNVITEFSPEIASFTPESVSTGLFKVKDRYEWKYDWETPYLDDSYSSTFANSFQNIELFAKTMMANGTKPECEFFGSSGLYNTRYLLREGLLKPPVHMQFVLGSLGGTGGYAWEVLNFQSTAMRLFGNDNFTWSLIGVGYPKEFELGALAISLGGHVRVGLEDNIYIRKGVHAKTNAELVETIVTLADIFGREVATPTDARRILGLKGMENTKI
jgi:uncharacterized protein (DUF849 family)